MTYSIVTIGGTIIETGLSKNAAEKLVAEKGSYYRVNEEEVTKVAEIAPTFEDMIESMEKPVWGSADTAQAAEKASSGHWSKVVNEGGEGYESNNW